MRAVPFKRIVFIVGMLMLSALAASAEEGGVMLRFPQADVELVMDFYSALTGRKVWLDPGVRGTVTIQTDKPIPKEEAIQLIRTQLLEKHGIEVREPNAKETFVTWSADPKYKEVIEANKKPVSSPPPAENPPGRRRVRIIR